MADPGNGHPDERVDITVLRGLCALIPLSLYCLYRASVRGCLDLIMGNEIVTRDSLLASLCYSRTIIN